MIRAWRMIWRNTSRLLYDHKRPARLKKNFYKTTIQPNMLYGIKCGIVGKRHIYKMSVAKMRILKWINENTWTYRI